MGKKAMISLYQKWQKSIGRDGPEYDVLADAHGAELEKLEMDLISNLGFYEALLLGDMKSVKAQKYLEQKLFDNTIDQTTKAAYAKALWCIENDPKYIQLISSVLTKKVDTDWIDKQTAINLLCGIKHPDAFDALETALYDKNYLVRFSAATIFSNNSNRQTSDQTIFNNIKEYDRKRIDKLAKILRNKIHT